MPPTPLPQPGQRLAIVGATGSGKTTLARALAMRLALPHIELDALHWGPNWTPAPRDTFRARVAEALTGERWIVDGNYSAVRDIVWARADTVIWLSYPLPLVTWRLLNRTLRRVLTQETLWGTNRESWRSQLSRDSLLLWLLKSYPRHQREYPLLFAQPDYQHLTVIRLRTPREMARWQRALPPRS